MYYPHHVDPYGTAAYNRYSRNHNGVFVLIASDINSCLNTYHPEECPSGKFCILLNGGEHAEDETYKDHEEPETE